MQALTGLSLFRCLIVVILLPFNLARPFWFSNPGKATLELSLSHMHIGSSSKWVVPPSRSPSSAPLPFFGGEFPYEKSWYPNSNLSSLRPGCHRERHGACDPRCCLEANFDMSKGSPLASSPMGTIFGTSVGYLAFPSRICRTIHICCIQPLGVRVAYPFQHHWSIWFPTFCRPYLVTS